MEWAKACAGPGGSDMLGVSWHRHSHARMTYTVAQGKFVENEMLPCIHNIFQKTYTPAKREVA